jgi:hypothetical protein
MNVHVSGSSLLFKNSILVLRSIYSTICYIIIVYVHTPLQIGTVEDLLHFGHNGVPPYP